MFPSGEYCFLTSGQKIGVYVHDSPGVHWKDLSIKNTSVYLLLLPATLKAKSLKRMDRN